MKQLIFLLALFISIQSVAQGIVKGKIRNDTGAALPFVTIQINDKIILSNEKGEYAITVPVRSATLQATAIGFEPLKKTITIQQGKTITIDLILTEIVKELQNVEIVGRKETGYTNSNSFVGTKTATALKDVPQAISYVTKEVMQDQQAIRMGDIVKNVSGVNQFTFYDDITIRGFRVQGGEGGVQLINGMRTTTGFWKQPLTNYLERVEVIKGPASALFGNTSPGGTINRVTKKPLTGKRQSISFTAGSFNTMRALADFTGSMNEEKTLLYRLNLGYENAGSFRDLQFDKNIVVAPSISFIPTEKTRFNFDLVYNKSNSRLDRGQAVFANADIYSVPASKSLNQVNDFLNEENYMLTTSLNHKIADGFQFNLAYVRTGYEEDLQEHRSANTYAKDSAGTIIPTLVEMQVFIRKRKRYVDNASAFLTYDFNLGKSKHKFLAGVDYSQEKQPFGGSQLQARGYRNNTNTGAANYNAAQPSKFLYETVNGIKRPVPNVAHFDLTAVSPYALQDMSKYFYTRVDFDPTFNSLHGFYLQDQVKLGRLQALVGLRYENFSDKTGYLKPTENKIQQNAFIPRIGLVFIANKNINFYATYAQGYQPQTGSTIANPLAGGPFDPLYSNLVEAGAKSEWFDKRLVVTSSIYRIQLKNVLYNAGIAGQPDLLRQIGKEEAKGFEFEATGQINPNWYVILAYAYNDAEITKSTRDEEIGKQKPNAPKNQGSFWTKYMITTGNLHGLGFGVGGNFVTKRNVSLSQIQTLPGYEVFNTAIYYVVNKFSLQLNVNNVLNKTFWVGGYDYLRLFPGAPRNWLTTVAYTF